MTRQLNNFITVGVFALTVACSTAAMAQAGPGLRGAGGPPAPGGTTPGMSSDTPGGRLSSSGMTSNEFGPSDNGSRVPGRDWPQPGSPGNRSSLPGAPPEFPARAAGGEKTVALNDAVSMVQERFNATAVKTDSVQRAGQLTYRIRLLSADKSKVWTVDVDARTGLIR